MGWESLLTSCYDFLGLSWSIFCLSFEPKTFWVKHEVPNNASTSFEWHEDEASSNMDKHHSRATGALSFRFFGCFSLKIKKSSKLQRIQTNLGPKFSLTQKFLPHFFNVSGRWQWPFSRELCSKWSWNLSTLQMDAFVVPSLTATNWRVWDATQFDRWSFKIH